MFERLKNIFFKRNKQSEIEDKIESTSCLSYCVDDDGELYIDVNLKDLEPNTVSNLAKLLMALSSPELYVETIETIKSGLINQGQPDLFILLAEEVADYAQRIREKEDEQEDEPCIKPLDML